MMHAYNYRVVQGPQGIGVYEVIYLYDGRPALFADVQSTKWSTLDDLKTAMARYQAALSHPVLSAALFTRELADALEAEMDDTEDCRSAYVSVEDMAAWRVNLGRCLDDVVGL